VCGQHNVLSYANDVITTMPLFVSGTQKVGIMILHQVLGSTHWQLPLILTLLASLFRR